MSSRGQHPRRFHAQSCAAPRLMTLTSVPRSVCAVTSWVAIPLHPSPDVERGSLVKRRVFLAGGATAVASGSALTACAPASPPSDQPLPPGDLDGAGAKLRAQYVAQFRSDYVDNGVLPSFLKSI